MSLIVGMPKVSVRIMLPLGNIRQQFGNLFLLAGFMIHERISHPLDCVTMPFEDHSRLLLGRTDKTLHLAINLSGSLVRIIRLARIVATKENLTIALAAAARAELLAHAVLRDHAPGDRRRFLNVVGRSGGRVRENEF